VTNLIHASKSRACPVCSGHKRCSWNPGELHFCRYSSGAVPGWIYLGQSKNDTAWGMFLAEGSDAPTWRQNNKPSAPLPPTVQHKDADKKMSAEECAAYWNRACALWGREGGKAARQRLQQELADRLGLPLASIEAVGYRLVPQPQSSTCYHWITPEYDGAGRIIGFPIRRHDGGKFFVTGSRRGISYVEGFTLPTSGVLFSVEGASDLAAMHAIGLGDRTICRPSATTTGAACEWMAELVRPAGANLTVCILGENDYDPERPDRGFPGRDGAEKTAARLAELLGDGDVPDVCWTMPPAGAKDVRDYGKRFCRPVRPHAATEFVRRILDDARLAARREPLGSPARPPQPPAASMPESAGDSENEGGSQKKRRPRRVQVPIDPVVEQRVRVIQGKNKPACRECPYYREQYDVHFTDDERTKRYKRRRRTIVGHVEGKEDFLLGWAPRCGGLYCCACRPLVIDERAIRHGDQLLQCETVTRLEVSEELYEATSRYLTSKGILWHRYRARAGGYVFYAKGETDLSRCRKVKATNLRVMTGEEACRLSGRELSSGHVAMPRGERKANGERVKENVFDACVPWREIETPEGKPKFIIEADSKSRDPEAIAHAFQSHGAVVDFGDGTSKRQFTFTIDMRRVKAEDRQTALLDFEALPPPPTPPPLASLADLDDQWSPDDIA
jgi:hypothetical protein